MCSFEDSFTEARACVFDILNSVEIESTEFLGQLCCVNDRKLMGPEK